MRISPLHETLAQAGATFSERHGVEIAASFVDADKEYTTVRDAVGVTDFSFMQKFTVPEETGIDFLDDLLTGNVAKVRFGRVLHTFLADDEGDLVADCYVANNDEEIILLCESLVDDETLKGILDKNGAQDAGLKEVTGDYVVLSVDGYKAWAVAKELFGADVLGLPYLSIEMYPFGGTEIRLVRAGKTSEFGYLLMAPVEVAEKLLDAVVEQARKNEGGLCGVEIHNDLRLEGRFFNIFAEGAAVKDPLKLGLQWMIDFDKGKFVGRDAILERREAGLTEKIIGVRCEGDGSALVPGAKISDGDSELATVVATCYSRILKAKLGLALFPTAIGYAGLGFKVGDADVVTISMPPIMPRSLGVKLDEL